MSQALPIDPHYADCTTDAPDGWRYMVKESSLQTRQGQWYAFVSRADGRQFKTHLLLPAVISYTGYNRDELHQITTHLLTQQAADAWCRLYVSTNKTALELLDTPNKTPAQHSILAEMERGLTEGLDRYTDRQDVWGEPSAGCLNDGRNSRADEWHVSHTPVYGTVDA